MHSSNMADSEETEEDVLSNLERSILQFRLDIELSDVVLVSVRECVERGKVENVCSVLLQTENKDVLEHIGWELIGLLTQTSDHIGECLELFDAIANICNPKEVCLGVVESLDVAKDLETFMVLLQPLQKAILRIPLRKSKFLNMALPQLLHRLKATQSPGSNLSGDNALSAVLKFLEVFVDDFAKHTASSYHELNTTTGDEKDYQQTLIKSLFSILEHPVSTLSMSPEAEHVTLKDGESEDKIENEWSAYHRTHGETIMKLLDRAGCSSVHMMEFASWHSRFYAKQASRTTCDGNPVNEDDGDDEDDDDNDEFSDLLPLLGLSCFAYLLLVEDLPSGHFPRVFSNEYLFKVNMKHIGCLLARPDNQIIFKGLELLSTLVARLENSFVEHYAVDSADVQKIAKELTNVMTLCTSKTLRQRAVKNFPQFLSTFDTRVRYMLLRYLLTGSHHAGVSALLIHAVKEEVNSALKAEEGKVWFTGSQLISLLQLVCKLPPGMGREADLVPETERVMAALNCVRFILLRDSDDKTTVWRNYEIFEKDFLRPLRDGITLTRLNYQASIKDEKTGKTEAATQSDNSDVEFSLRTPDGQPISLMPREDQREVLQSGLYALDMMECVLSHINEISSSR